MSKGRSMRLGFFSDAHANPHATRDCIRLLRDRGAEELFFLGDATGYLGRHLETLEEIESACGLSLLGNHEAYALGLAGYQPAREAVYRAREAAAALGPAWTRRLARRIPSGRVGTALGELLLVHGSPWDPLHGYVYPDSDLSAFAALAFQAVVMGHTHRPFIARSGGVLVVNCGSCGLPRDRGDLGSCALFDLDTGEAEILRFPIDAGLAVHDDAGVHESVRALFRRRPDGGETGQGDPE